MITFLSAMMTYDNSAWWHKIPFCFWKCEKSLWVQCIRRFSM